MDELNVCLLDYKINLTTLIYFINISKHFTNYYCILHQINFYNPSFYVSFVGDLKFIWRKQMFG